MSPIVFTVVCLLLADAETRVTALLPEDRRWQKVSYLLAIFACAGLWFQVVNLFVAGLVSLPFNTLFGIFAGVLLAGFFTARWRIRSLKGVVDLSSPQS